MDSDIARRITEAEVKIANAKDRLEVVETSGEDAKYLKQRLTDLNAVREKLVEQQTES